MIQNTLKPDFDFENVKTQFPDKYKAISEKSEVEYWGQVKKLQKEVPNYKVSENQAKKDIQKRIEFYLKNWYENN